MNTELESIDTLEMQMIRAGALHPDDLMFNQAGELSPGQKRWLTIEVAAWGVQIVIDVALIVCAWFVYYFQYPNNAALFIVSSSAWSIALGAGIFACCQHAQPVWADIKSNEVKLLSGTISKHTGWGPGVPEGSKRPRGANWSFQIREHLFSVHSPVYDSLIEHQSYSVFYTPALKRVINIELLMGAHEKKQSALDALQRRTKENEEKPS